MTNPIDCFGLPGWTWFNRPGQWSPRPEGLDVTTEPGTDFWVTTHYGFVRDTGHALLRPVPDRFRLRVTFSGAYRDQYDQAGLLLRLDATNWIKTGVEYADGDRLLSAVVTREFSDWSVVPLSSVADPEAPVTIELRREGDTVTVLHGADDAEPETMLRLAYFPPGMAAQAGPMCASPQGRGFTTRFSDLNLE